MISVEFDTSVDSNNGIFHVLKPKLKIAYYTTDQDGQPTIKDVNPKNLDQMSAVFGLEAWQIDAAKETIREFGKNLGTVAELGMLEMDKRTQGGSEENSQLTEDIAREFQYFSHLAMNLLRERGIPNTLSVRCGEHPPPTYDTFAAQLSSTLTPFTRAWIGTDRRVIHTTEDERTLLTQTCQSKFSRNFEMSASGLPMTTNHRVYMDPTATDAYAFS
ncbi:uncharacterized protein I206_106736 [Kwoniella pini CBS 10737]|uniref:Uncharacterized protein n=1 Tax=Kwoniella pini CBS 10737 TaxID=1296096 RepID=A0A1B9HTC5_9TREE|nr:uncharacterized protein I206_07376 [Kwoniella pini CBS 10737]OCF46523.1 hypothetical protein I206_07376 [Kwoniella pini CBS 10737]